MPLAGEHSKAVVRFMGVVIKNLRRISSLFVEER